MLTRSVLRAIKYFITIWRFLSWHSLCKQLSCQSEQLAQRFLVSQIDPCKKRSPKDFTKQAYHLSTRLPAERNVRVNSFVFLA